MFFCELSCSFLQTFADEMYSTEYETFLIGDISKTPGMSKEAARCSEAETEEAGSSAGRHQSEFCAHVFQTRVVSNLRFSDKNKSIRTHSEKVFCNQGECRSEVPRDPGFPGGGSEDHFVPSGDGGACGRLCFRWSHGEELRPHSGVGAGLSPVQLSTGPDQQGAGFCSKKSKLENKSITSQSVNIQVCCSSVLLFVP